MSSILAARARTVGHTRGVILGGAAASALAFASAPAFAAETTATGPAAPATVEEIVVTGSQIRGVAPVGSTLIAVGHNDLVKSGALTASDALKQVPQISQLGVDESHRGAQGGVGNIFYNNQVNLRSLGPQATLTLLNGHRAPSTGTSGYSFDPSVIPTLALERIEVIADGASAIYGSDAVAGVANLITRRNYEGAEVNLRGGGADHYSEGQFGFIIGHRFDRASVMVAFESAYHSQLRGQDRDFFAGDLTSRGGANYATNQCNPGTIVIGGVPYAIPAGGVTPATASRLVANTRNTCDTYDYRSLLPRQNRNSGTFSLSYDVNDRVKLRLDGYGYQRDFKLVSASSFPGQTLTVPRTNAYYVAPPGTNPASEQVLYFMPGIGTGIFHFGKVTSYQATLSADIALTADWSANLSASYGRDDSFAHYAQINSGNLTAALASSNPQTALNPYTDGLGTNTVPLIQSLYDNVLYAPGRNVQKIVQGKVDGPLFHLPGGPLRAAFGFEYRDEMLATGSTSGPASARVAIRFYPSRQITAFFAEGLIPIVGPDNALPFVQKLDVDLAVRREDYSDVGTTTNPKIGINWTPFSDLVFHASYGTSFRAPTLSNFVSTNASLGVMTVFDPKVGGNVQVLQDNEANPNVRPETAKTYSVGFDYSPGWLPGFRLNLNYFDINYRNQITSVLGQATILQQESLYQNLIIRNPSAAFLAPYLARLPLRNGALPAVVAAFIDARPQNLGITLASGVDFVVTYHWDADRYGDFTAGLNGSYFTKYKVSQTPSAPLANELNRLNYPQRYHWQARLDWSRGPVNASFWVDHLSGYFNDAVKPFQRVDSYTVANLHAAYALDGERFEWTKGVTLSVDVNNMFDQDPPFVNIAGGFDPNAASAIGRRVLFTVNKKF